MGKHKLNSESVPLSTTIPHVLSPFFIAYVVLCLLVLPFFSHVLNLDMLQKPFSMTVEFHN